jgi:hypothetical protein
MSKSYFLIEIWQKSTSKRNIDETLINFIKQNTQQRGKRRTNISVDKLANVNIFSQDVVYFMSNTLAHSCATYTITFQWCVAKVQQLPNFLGGYILKSNHFNFEIQISFPPYFLFYFSF